MNTHLNAVLRILPCPHRCERATTVQTLFVWPNRVIVGMGGREAAKEVVPLLQPRIKGILAISLHRGVQLPGTCAAASLPSLPA